MTQHPPAATEPVAQEGDNTGRWIVERDVRDGMEWNSHIVSADDPTLRICFMAHSGSADNSKFEAWADLIASAPQMASDLASLRAENARLREALEGVIRVADRKTVEFDAARAAIASKGAV